MRILTLFVAVVFMVVGTGCGTILHGSNQQIMLQSEPSGAEVYSNGTLLGRTPSTVTLGRNATHPLIFRMAGYADQPFQITRGIDGVALVGDLLLGVVPLVVDFATGSMYKLSPSQAIVVMNRQGASLGPASSTGNLAVQVYTRAEVEQLLGPNVLVGATVIGTVVGQ